MINQQIISIDNSTNGTTISTFVPFSLILSTSAFIPTNKIWKITYDFGNGEIQEKTLGLDFALTDPSALPYSDEPNDPRNALVTTNYFFDNFYYKNYTVNINFYEIGTSIPETVTFTLNLSLPTTQQIFSNFSTVKLVGSRMYGLDNKLMLIFESQEPNYLIPVLAKF